MNPYRFYYPIDVRYGDIDPQRHVNNARYFTFMEQARIQYLMMLGLWSGDDFDNIGIILAEQSCTYLAAITLQHKVEVGVHIGHMGSKSIEMIYSLRDIKSQKELATGRSILVAYDYGTEQSIPIPKQWRDVIARFESGASSDEQEAVDIKAKPE